MDDLWVWFDGDAFALTQDAAEGDGGEVMGDELLCSGLVFVGGYGEFHALLVELCEQLGDGGIGGAEVCVVEVVIGDEGGSHAKDVGFALFAFWEGAFEELVDTVAHHEGVC